MLEFMGLCVGFLLCLVCIAASLWGIFGIFVLVAYIICAFKGTNTEYESVSKVLALAYKKGDTNGKS